MNAKIKQKRNNNFTNLPNSIPNNNNNNREPSNEPWIENQRIDTGGGEYHQFEEENPPYNPGSKASPRAAIGSGIPKGKKKNLVNGTAGGLAVVSDDVFFNRQSSKKGIIGGGPNGNIAAGNGSGHGS